MTKKKVAAFFTAAALCGALAVGSSMAYLTDHDSVTNKFSVGKVDIVALPEGFNTYVGERGTLLSGGQPVYYYIISAE